MSDLLSIQDWGIRKVVTTSAFVGIILIQLAVTVGFQTIAVHLVPYAMDVGVSPIASAAAIGLLGGFSVPGRIISGFMMDKIHCQKILALACFGMGLSLLWLLFLKGAWMLYCFVLCYGICHGSKSPAHIRVLAEFFGMRSLGELIGIAEAITMFIGAFAPYITGFIFDTTGSYLPAFRIMMVLLFSSGIVASVMKKPVVFCRK